MGDHRKKFNNTYLHEASIFSNYIGVILLPKLSQMSVGIATTLGMCDLNNNKRSLIQ